MMNDSAGNRKKETRELSLYVHIPFCKEKCKYCDFLSFSGCGYNEHKQYVMALCREIEAYESIAEEYTVKTIFLGGGTPSYIEASLIEEIMDTIHRIFFVEQDAEITIEGNPDSLLRDKLAVYRNAGINRLSIGLQSANDATLQVLGRVHNYDQFIAAYSSARQAGFENINIDLMSGLPGEKKEAYIRTLAKAVQLQPEHISAYSLIVEEGTPLSENEALLEQLPSEEEDRQLYARTKLLLRNSGYGRYEISNYAKKGFECQHNITYWTGGEYLGFGLGASSYLKIWTAENQYKQIRFHGIENLKEYIGRFSKCEGMREDNYTEFFYAFGNSSDDVDEKNKLLEFIRDYYKDLYFLKRKDEMEEFMFLGLRMMSGISKSEFKRRFGVTVDSVYGNVIMKYKERHLLLEKEDRLYLSDTGIDVSNVVMAEFML